MEKTCKCKNCGTEMACPMHCEKHMEEKDDVKMHCTMCEHTEDKPKCEKCGGEVEHVSGAEESDKSEESAA